ncbi:MAG: DUF5916 domain-containing protein [Candidatus Eisenbacteria bacterium]
MKRWITGTVYTCIAALALMAVLPCRAEPQEPHRVPKLSSDVNVDGHLDERIWEKALLLTLDYEVRPSENVPPPVKTEILLAYDETHLYCGVRAYDPDPSQICARLCDRDNLWDDDWFALNLDTFNDQRRSYLLFCNPLGVQADNIEVTGGDGTEWDPIWDSAGRITEEGYVLEMAVPFSSLRFQRTDEDQIWGIDAIRSYPRSVRHHIGLFPRDRDNNCYLCQAEKLIGFAGATPGRNIELAPTFSTVHTQIREDEDVEEDFLPVDSSYEPGLTARWGLTPNLTLSGTLNPDFSQVEADAAQLDINTQYAIYYSERRPFFLEYADIFHSELQIVHTRTLADPAWGIKLTGKERPENTIGAFMVMDKVTNLLIPGNEGSETTELDTKSLGSVLRSRRDVGSSSTLGMLFTDREGNDYYNRVGGFDCDMRITEQELVRFNVLGSQTRYPDTVVSEFGQPDGVFQDMAFDFFYMHSTRGLDYYAILRDVGSDFRADLGYRPKVGYRFGEAGWGHTWHNDSDHWYNMLNFGMGYEYEEKESGDLLYKGVASWFNFSGRSQSFVNMWGFYGRQKYDRVDFNRRILNLEGGFWPTCSLFLFLDATVGDGIDYDHTREGTEITLEPFVEYLLGCHLRFEIGHTFQRLDVDEGRLYTANISRLKAIYQINRRSFLRAILQYMGYDQNTDLFADADTKPRETYLLSQLLFSYKVNPQTVLFVGYNDGYYSDQDISLTQSDRTVFVKVGYAWTL